MELKLNEYHHTFGDFQITVRDGEVTEVQDRNPFQGPPGPYTPLENFENYTLDFYIDVLPSQVTDYTVDNLFDSVKLITENMTAVNISACQFTKVEFDPTLGYIQTFQFVTYYFSYFCGGQGTHTAGVNFSISNFEILE